jgi:hypothetical protein
VQTHAALSYPKYNRHVMFRGNLAHGVAGTLSQSTEARVTFLVNYWQYQPIEPNCIHVDNSLMRQIGLGLREQKLPNGESLEEQVDSAEPVLAQGVDFGAYEEGEGEREGDGRGGSEGVEIELRKDDHWFITVPKQLPPNLWNLHWDSNQVANLVQVRYW